jgi:hypothetical protein
MVIIGVMVFDTVTKAWRGCLKNESQSVPTFRFLTIEGEEQTCNDYMVRQDSLCPATLALYMMLSDRRRADVPSS